MNQVLVKFTVSLFLFLKKFPNFIVQHITILNALMDLYITGGPLITVRRYDLKLNGNYRSVLRWLRKSPDNQVVVVGSTDSMYEFFRQVSDVYMRETKKNVFHQKLKFNFKVTTVSS